MSRGLVLGGDLGGTKTLLAIAEERDGALVLRDERRYENAAYPSFPAVVARFLADTALASTPVHAAGIGIAGPVEGRRVKVTNLPWTVDADELVPLLGGAPVRLLNDFAAAAHGVAVLAPDRVAVLQPGEPLAHGPQLVIGAGTGLGVAFRVWTGTHYQVVPGEGGHFGFAPADATQTALAAALRARLGRVIVEHVVSGPGLGRIHAFMLVRDGLASPSGEASDPAAVTREALELGDPRALEALDLFVACYGAVAGDYALACMARGGVYLAGGIAPKLLARLRAGGFLRAFRDKGAHAALAARFPVHVVLDERVGLLGALAAALHEPNPEQ